MHGLSVVSCVLYKAVLKLLEGANLMYLNTSRPWGLSYLRRVRFPHFRQQKLVISQISEGNMLFLEQFLRLIRTTHPLIVTQSPTLGPFHGANLWSRTIATFLSRRLTKPSTSFVPRLILCDFLTARLPPTPHNFSMSGSARFIGQFSPRPLIMIPKSGRLKYALRNVRKVDVPRFRDIFDAPCVQVLNDAITEHSVFAHKYLKDRLLYFTLIQDIVHSGTKADNTLIEREENGRVISLSFAQVANLEDAAYVADNYATMRRQVGNPNNLSDIFAFSVILSALASSVSISLFDFLSFSTSTPSQNELPSQTLAIVLERQLLHFSDLIVDLKGRLTANDALITRQSCGDNEDDRLKTEPFQPVISIPGTLVAETRGPQRIRLFPPD
ncbi:uncharacterized protein BDR25DRAFT_350138 [Lindgomyces ingoldianus]|uniref:Uncharacterized protein n=1 Tax=Lindgomyces ingoldianus TaxID=673940 RepID=A0ACB6R9U7_9PLEO|nr:uncharacterized protein BDR25DRAFT_350138 [Lindgomyces ingoldianus]KAF2475862.1 hypothetical protein BDR25DRAFT_350138 [Lindgomyces ingoldianus]